MRLNLDFENDLPDGWVALEAVAVVKCLSADGTSSLCIRGTKLNPWEALGMTEAASQQIRNHLNSMFEEE